MVINAASLANIGLFDFEEKMAELYKGGVRFFHIDLMDGHYVKNLCFPLTVVRDTKKRYPDCVTEVHMMVDNPMDYVSIMKEYGTDYLSFHTDSTKFVRRTLSAIRDAGMKAGVALNPSQRIDILEPYAAFLDHVVFMSVEPGFAGQKFLPGSLERLKELAVLRKSMGLEFLIIVDGGVDYELAPKCIRNGADAIVGTVHTIFNQPEGIVKACGRFNRELGHIEIEI